MPSSARASGPLVASAGAVAAAFLLMACTLDTSGTHQGGSAGASGASSGGTGGAPPAAGACAAILRGDPNARSGVHLLDPDGAGPRAPFNAYCEMDPAEDGGGWTLALKIDGDQPTFAYDSPLWQDATPYQEDLPDFDQNEAKLDTFSKIGFEAVRLGMTDAGQTRWIVLPIAGESLAAILQGGSYTPTSVGRDAWKGLLASPSLQPECNMEGFNAVPSNGRSVRIGIMANEQPDCTSVDSFIGLGGTIVSAQVSFPSGNWSGCCGGDQGDRDTRTFGYVMVR